jgi:hypothetical protein
MDGLAPDDTEGVAELDSDALSVGVDDGVRDDVFLYLAWQNVHWPLMAPADYVARFANTTGGAGDDRNYVAAMMSFVDDAVGNVTAAISAAGLDDNTIVVLVSDNGGPTNGDEGTASSNFPLRGGKNTLWEGGTRVIGMVRGPGVAVGVTSTAKVRARGASEASPRSERSERIGGGFARPRSERSERIGGGAGN